MEALDGTELDRRLTDLAHRAPDASVYAVDAVGARFVPLPQRVKELFSWSLTADSPIELIASSHRVTGAELFVQSRKVGSASGIVRLADNLDHDVELNLLNAGDTVIGIVTEATIVTEAAIVAEAPVIPEAPVVAPEIPTEPTPDLLLDDTAETALGEPLPDLDLTPSSTTLSSSTQSEESEALITPTRVGMDWDTSSDRSGTSSATGVGLAAGGATLAAGALVVDATSSAPAAETVSPVTPTVVSDAPAEAPADRLVLHLDQNGLVTDANATTLRVLGRSRDALVGTRLASLLHPEDSELVSRSWYSLLAEPGGRRRLRCRYLRSDGSVLWVVQNDRNALETEHGVVVSELVDVTEEVLAEQMAMFESTLFEEVDYPESTGLAYLSEDRTVQFANQRWSSLTGLGDDAPFYEFVACVTDPASLEASITRALGYGEPGESVVTVRGVNDIPARRLRLHTRPLVGPQDKRGVVVALDEIPQVRLNSSGEPETRRTVSNDPTTPPVGLAAPRVEVPTTQPTRSAPEPAPQPESAPEPLAPLTAPAQQPVAPVTAPPPPPPPPPPVQLPAAAPEAPITPERVVTEPHRVEPTARQTVTEPVKRIEPDRTARLQPSSPPETDAASRWSSWWSSDADEPGTRSVESQDVGQWKAVWVWIAAAVATAIAAGVRFWKLGTVPDGLLGLEQSNLALADQAIDTTDIGTYSLDGLGQPAGPLYALGAVSSWLSDSVFDSRLISVVVGCLSVAALFWFARRWFDPLVATASAITLALMGWHLHYSRLALGSIWWPLLLTISLGLLAPALKRRAAADANLIDLGSAQRNQHNLGNPLRWLIAGVFLGAGVWVSNAHWAVLFVTLATLFLWFGITARSAGAGGFGRFLALAIGAVGVAAPVGLRILRDEAILDRFDQIDARTGDAWESKSFFGQLGQVAQWWWNSWWELLVDPVANSADGLGLALPVSYVIGLMAAVGLIVLWWRDRSILTWIFTALLIVIPFGPALTTSRALRHGLALSPMLALLAGLGIAWVLRTIHRGFGSGGRWIAGLVALALVGLIGWSTISGYFDVFANDPGLAALVGG